jgi:hypothetical protein
MNARDLALLEKIVMNVAQSSSAPFVLEPDECPSLKNHAVARCAAAWDNAYRASMLNSKSAYAAGNAAAKAYRQAMPSLCGEENICDFIACAGYGMLLGAIKEENGSKYLYAAQVAFGSIAKSKKQTRSAV